MTSGQCQTWLKDYLRTHPVPVTGQLSREALKTYTPLGEFIALAAWRTGKTIIRCDAALLEALDKTGLHDALPAGALLRLPFWGFYLEFPSYRVAMPHPDVQDIPAHGAFITLTDAADGRGTDLLALVVGAGATSQEGYHPTMTTYLPVAGTTGEALSALRSALTRHFWRTVLPVLFYLCAENTDWGDAGAPLRSEPKKVRRKGERFFEPPQTQVLDVGGWGRRCASYTGIFRSRWQNPGTQRLPVDAACVHIYAAPTGRGTGQDKKTRTHHRNGRCAG